MEWIVISAKTVPQAVERALDTLGVHETELEYEVVEEAKAGFLGIRRADAKIKARVKPISREKPNDKRRRQQKERRAKSGPREKSQGDGSPPQPKSTAAARNDASESSDNSSNGDGEKKTPNSRNRNRNRNRGGQNKSDRAGADTAGIEDGDRSDDNGSANELRESTSQPAAASTKAPRPPKREATPVATGTIEEQMTHARVFAEGFLTAWGIDGAVGVEVIADDVVEVAITGSNLGLLVGPKGATLASIEELLRGSVGHRGPARLHLDVAGYRSKRREALANFALTVARQVLETGSAKALEPMSSQDRKVVHDAITELEGVTTISDGEDAQRRVIIQPSA